MAEIYIRNWEDETNTASHPKTAPRKGDVLFIQPDGHSDNPNWQLSQEANTDKLLMVKCPELSESAAEVYAALWKEDFGYTVLKDFPNQGRYDVVAFEKTPGVAGENNLTQEKIESFLSLWNCSEISFDNNACYFSFLLWPASRSVGFWESVIVVSSVDFVLESYSGQTGWGEISAQVLDNPQITPATITANVTIRGGEVLEANHPYYRYRLHRSSLFEWFKRDVKKKAENLYRRHRYYVSQGTLDWILAQGNGPTVTLEQLLTYLIDKAS